MNIETYKTMSVEFNGACHSVSMATSGRYLLTQSDKKNGYYVMLNECGISLKIPFRALFETNNKINPINALSFCSAIDCPSDKRGLCQLDEHCGLCYAKVGHLRASGIFRTKGDNKGCRQINSLQSSRIVERAIDALYENKALYMKFLKYVNDNISIIRFNLKGDFRHTKDIKLLKNIADYCDDTILCGYSARDDILTPDTFSRYEGRIFLNGSNMKYTNRFKVTKSLKEYFRASHICQGGCKGCANCFTLIDCEIVALLHGKEADKVLNTSANREFLTLLIGALDNTQTWKPEDFTARAGLFDSLKYQMEVKGLGLELESFKELKELIDCSHFELKDEPTVNYEVLVALGVA